MRIVGYRPEQFFINIKPICGYQKIIWGPAFTTKGQIVKNDSNYSELDNIRINIYNKKNFTDKPIVLLEANDNYCAHSGDITSQIYQSLGSAGFITDGNIRDVDKVEKLNYPVFCLDSNPIDAINYWALTDYQVPIKIMGVKIFPGDFIFASRDGVIRVQKNDLEIFNKNLNMILLKEDKVRNLIKKIKNKNSYESDLLGFIKQYDRW